MINTIIGERCPVCDYTEKKIVTINAYKKEMRNELEIIRKLTSSSSPWAQKIKTDKIWICESVGKLKGIGKQGKVKIDKINVHTIADELMYISKWQKNVMQKQRY